MYLSIPKAVQLAKSGHRLLYCSKYNDVCHAAWAALREQGIAPGIMTGSTPMKDRITSIRHFNSGIFQAMVITRAVAGGFRLEGPITIGVAEDWREEQGWKIHMRQLFNRSRDAIFVFDNM